MPLAMGALLAAGCTKAKPITEPFSDTFERQEVGEQYSNTGGPYAIQDGKLRVKGAYNHPLWLRSALPRDAVIEVDVTSKTPDGDIKLEAWGDGQSHATSKGAYLATSYVFIFGGWNNQISALCRMDEHAADREERKDVKVEPGRTYHWKIKRKGNKVEWFIDGEPFLSMDDPAPLEGSRHRYLGFNNWQSEVLFDNLKITPL
jgi:hypothetical protein